MFYQLIDLMSFYFKLTCCRQKSQQKLCYLTILFSLNFMLTAFCFYYLTKSRYPYIIWYLMDLQFIHSFYYHPSGRQKLLNACVSIWTKVHKFCKARVIINQILQRCFCSCGFYLNKSNHQVKQVDTSKQTDVNQSIFMN